MDTAVKTGLALEQSKLKQGTFIRSRRKNSRMTDCETCTFPTHADGKCPAKKLECFDCGKTGHHSGSKACKQREDSRPLDRKLKKEKKTQKVKEQETEDSDTDTEPS